MEGDLLIQFTSFTIMFGIIILFFNYVFGQALGRLWAWIGAATGMVWLVTQASHLMDLIAPAADTLYRILDLLVPQTPGPLTSFLRDAASSFMPDIFEYYVDGYESLALAAGSVTVSSDSGMALLILKMSGLSIFIALLAAVYVNAELLLVLIIVNTAYRIARRQIKIRRQKTAQSGAEQEIRSDADAVADADAVPQAAAEVPSSAETPMGAEMRADAQVQAAAETQTDAAADALEEDTAVPS